MRGSVMKPGQTWTYVVDVGRDPETNKRRERWKGGLATKRAAEFALRQLLGQVDAGVVPDSG